MNEAIIYGRTQQKLNISDTAAQTAVLAAAVYDVWSNVDCYIAIGPNASTGLTTDAGYVLFANNVVSFDVRNGDKIGAICATGVSGVLRFHQVG